MLSSIIASICILAFIIFLNLLKVSKDSRCAKCGEIIPKGENFCKKCEKK